MKVFSRISLALVLAQFVALSAHADFARRPIKDSEHFDGKQAVVSLFNAEMAKPASTLAKAVKEKLGDDPYTVLVDPEASDVSLIESGNSAGEFCANSLLPLRYGFKSNTVTFAYLRVGHCIDDGSGKGSFVFIDKFVDVTIGE